MTRQQSKEKTVVVISSTAIDLPDYRAQVIDACLRMGMFPIMLEHLPALDADAVQASLDLVEKADIYVGLFAHRYGYIPDGYDISITEMEYERATELGIPRLVFLMDLDVPVLPKDVDRGERAVKLEKFKDRLKKERVVSFFKNPDDLRAQIIHSLDVFKTRLEAAKPDKLPAEDTSRIRKLLRVFVASPSDVVEERKRMVRVVKSINRTLGKLKNVVVELWKWEDDAIPGVGEPQALIDPELDESDAIVVIFWNRFGMETSTGETGTEREVLRAFQRWKNQGRPQILMYFCQRPAVLNKDESLQRIRVLEFREMVSSMALTLEYKDVSEFERRVRDDLFLTLAEFSE